MASPRLGRPGVDAGVIDLVIFDCDGVLVDSEPIANRVFAEALAELGLQVSLDEMYADFVGRSMSYCMRLVEARLGRPAPADFVTRLQERTFAAFEAEGLQATEGIHEALDAIALPMCVASSGEIEKMRFTLGLTGLLPRFDGRLFSVTQVEHGKPAPDIYLYAAKQMGAQPSRCVVVEDSPAGARAGLAAGMTVLGYCAHTPAESLARLGVHCTFAGMRELPGLLKRAAER
ncbi:MAG: HAD family hydrolase [Xanthomonadaceae bacterium]|nr:HAD family hydrolase [Xanthomonadaceae bacterium]